MPKSPLQIGACYQISTSKGPLYYTIKSGLGDEYTCDVNGEGVKNAHEERNVKGSVLRKGMPVRVNEKRRRGEERNDLQVVRPAKVAKCGFEEVDIEESSYISPGKMVIRAALKHYALLYHGRTGNRPVIGMIDHHLNGAVEYYKRSDERFFGMADFVIVNNDEESCAILKAKFSKDENVQVACGDFADVIDKHTFEAPEMKFSILWADICNELQQPELEVFKKKISSSGRILYTHSTRSNVAGRDVQQVLQKIERMHAAANLPEYEKYRYQNGHSTMIHVEVAMREQGIVGMASPWLQASLVAGLRAIIATAEGLLARLV